MEGFLKVFVYKIENSTYFFTQQKAIIVLFWKKPLFVSRVWKNVKNFLESEFHHVFCIAFTSEHGFLCLSCCCVTFCNVLKASGIF